MTLPTLAAELGALAEKATPGPWRSMRDGNQYINTGYLPTAKLVGASRIEGLQRPWNPHAYMAFGLKADAHEIVRFMDADADYIAACDPTTIQALLARLGELEAEPRRARNNALRDAINFIDAIDDGESPAYRHCQEAIADKIVPLPPSPKPAQEV